MLFDISIVCQLFMLFFGLAGLFWLVGLFFHWAGCFCFFFGVGVFGLVCQFVLVFLGACFQVFCFMDLSSAFLVGVWFFVESLILAQDERWRRA